jgi:small subunit ribosomal protein S17
MSAAEMTVRGKRKAKVGRVVSDKMDKTIVVSVERLSRHRVYKRVIRLTSKFKAHDERNEARIGDTVRIEESRPLSATKRWRLSEIISRADDGAGSLFTGEEPETSEVIHMAAHPGRDAAHAADGDGDATAPETAAEDTSADDEGATA